MDYPPECFAGATDDVSKLPVSGEVDFQYPEEELGEGQPKRLRGERRDKEYPDIRYELRTIFRFLFLRLELSCDKNFKVKGTYIP